MSIFVDVVLVLLLIFKQKKVVCTPILYELFAPYLKACEMFFLSNYDSIYSLSFFVAYKCLDACLGIHTKKSEYPKQLTTEAAFLVSQVASNIIWTVFAC